MHRGKQLVHQRRRNHQLGVPTYTLEPPLGTSCYIHRPRGSRATPRG
jgi:hypothetical protein